MNYAELCTAIEDTVENSFTPEQLERFVRQAEKMIYNTVSLPAMQRNSIGTLTVGNPYLTQPPRLLSVLSVAVVVDGVYQYLLPKQSSFIREAYPEVGPGSVPKYYGFFDQNSFIVGPTPDDSYHVEIQYSSYPESIVTAGTTWLGEEFDNALLNASLVEAGRFLKLEAADMNQYQSMLMQSLTILKQLGDGKMKGDVYRSGEFVAPRG
jgi:hypothetical protein